MSTTKQAITSYVCGYVQPSGHSNQRLGCGVYSLSARSNVPFVRIQGRTVDKTITWGEIAEVPFGELCSVINASWHGGDIFINSGCDYDNQPARITIPVPFSLQAGALAAFWGPLFPADVRTARRAYLCFDAEAQAIVAPVFVLGIRFDGSHNTQNQIVPLFGYNGAGFSETRLYPPASEIGMIPLGHRASPAVNDGRPHTLLTVGLAFVSVGVLLHAGPSQGPVTLPNAYYTMEY